MQKTISLSKLAVVRHLKAILATIPLVGTVIGLFALWGGEEWRDRYIDLALLNAVYWVFILHLLWEVISHECPQTFRLPQVKAVMRAEHLLIVENSPWLGVGVMATIYVLENDFERFVCTGEVINVQMNDLVQIAARATGQQYASEDEFWTTLERIDRAAILVKPGPIVGGT
ncbi:MAG: hypothetical protein OXI81_16955 [Paracoccaceae bacterium]|nr:hypothetical protein [Paracoccaceae bacterium]